MRDAAGLTIEQVAQHLECSDSKISRIEKGQVGALPRDVADMLDLYRINDWKRDEILQLTRQARRRPWWEIEFHDLPLAYASYEAAARTISAYQVLVVLGLLQTEDYARAVLRALRPGLQPLDVEGRVEVRVRQQAILTRPEPPRLHVVLDEGVLRRPVGSAAVMRRQLERLIEWSERPNITIQVLRFAVYLENTTNDFLVEEADAVARYQLLFAHLCEQALGAEESRSFISKAGKDL